MTEGAWRVREGQLRTSAGRDGEGGVDVAGGRRREEEDEEDGCACLRSICSLAILAQVLSCDSLPPAAPANVVWWRGGFWEVPEFGGLAWGCLGVMVSGVAAGVVGFRDFRLLFGRSGWSWVSPGPGGRTWTNVSHEGLEVRVDKRGRTFCDSRSSK